MKPYSQALCLLSGLAILSGAPAIAGVDTAPAPSTDTCMTDKGSLCPPQGATEEVVPEYYNVPTTTKHIYYKKPVVKPIVTHVVHHVPTPVYGGETRTETVQAGPWHGAPAVSCCHRAPRPAQPVYAPPPRPVYVAPYVAPRPVQTHSPCQARQTRYQYQPRVQPQHQPRVQQRPCR